MVDNKGPDSDSGTKRAKRTRGATSFAGPQKPSLGNSPDPLTGMRNWAYNTPSYQPRGQTYAPSQQNTGFFGEIGNFLNDSTRNLNNFIGSNILGEKSPFGGGRGDAMVGSNPLAPARPGKRMRPVGGGGPGQQAPVGTSPLSFADALAQALGLVGDQGGGIPGVNYDSERNAARQNAGEADARLGAMYRQLTDAIQGENPNIQAAYQGAIDSTNAGAQQAQRNVQGAVDASQARNQSVLSNLGIGDANQQIIAQGRDANTAGAQQIADMAAGQQAATTNLTANQASSVQQNRSIGSAAGLEGNLQRAQNQARLQALLAKIDSSEQDQNAQIAAQNASQKQGGVSTALSLASQLYGMNRDDIDRENSLQIEAAKMNRPSGVQQGVSMLSQLLNKNGGLFSSEEALNQDQLIKLLLGLSK